jgi:hypothetical protein
LQVSKKQFAIKLMLDSGVFSAWNRGQEIKLKEYIAYLKDHKEWLYSYVNLDQIPGEFGRTPTQADVAQSARVGYDNFQKMKAEGLDPIPVFHQGEDIRWLERMINDGDKYIGLATRKDVWAIDQRRWLDKIFSIITNAKGEPLVKTHGFGITRPGFLFRYPWFSTDSTTWSLTPGYGQILVPRYKNGKPDYLHTPQKVIMSGIQPSVHAQTKNQFEALGPATQDHILQFLDEVCGLTIEQVRYQTNTRRTAMLIYYVALCKALHHVTFHDRTSGGLNRDGFKHNLKAPPKPWNLQIFFATALNRSWNKLMLDTNANTRLLSYYEMREKSTECLQQYVENGVIITDPRKPRKTVTTKKTPITQERKKEVIELLLAPGADLDTIAHLTGIKRSALALWQRKAAGRFAIMAKWKREVYVNIRRASIAERSKRAEPDGQV